MMEVGKSRKMEERKGLNTPTEAAVVTYPSPHSGEFVEGFRDRESPLPKERKDTISDVAFEVEWKSFLPANAFDPEKRIFVDRTFSIM